MSDLTIDARPIPETLTSWRDSRPFGEVIQSERAAPVRRAGCDWWRFPFDAGRKLAALGIFDRRIKCAILMPLIDYAAPFLIAGLLIGRAAERLRIKDEQSPAEHFAKIKSLAKWTKLLVCHDSEIFLGATKGYFRDRVDRKDTIKIEYEFRNTWIADPYDGRLLRKFIFPISPEIEDSLTANVSFLSGIAAFSKLVDDDIRVLAELIAAPNKRITICGDKNQILEEARADLILSKANRPFPVGPFNNVLQLENLAGTTLPWTRCVSTLASEREDEVHSPVTLLRGSRAFLRHAHNMADKSWIAIIGANEARMPDAVSQFNSMFIERVSDLENSGWPEPMRGAEIMGFMK